MSLTRKFIDWSLPALAETVRFLDERYRRENVWDLDQVILVLPGRRAGRRLSELLVGTAEKQSATLLPPVITTVGALPELLYQSKLPFADDLLQKLVWVHALRGMRRQASSFIAQLPDDDDVRGWLDLGTLLWRQHRELAGDGLNFADVVKIGATLPNFPEVTRWKFLHQVQNRYLEQLDKLQFWDLQTARLYAIEQKECQTDHEIVLVATADMNRATRQMLDQVADRVTALVHAPAEMADHFDRHGCIVPPAWEQVPIDIETQQVQIRDTPADQADAVADTIAQYGGKFRADQISVGVADDRLVPHIERQLLQAGTESRWVAGTRLCETPAFRLLAGLSAYLQSGRYADFAALVRHPTMHDWLQRQGIAGGWLAQLDEYYNKHLPPRLGDWLGKAERSSELPAVYQTIQQQLVEPFTGDPRKLGDWSTTISQVLQVIFADQTLDADDPADHQNLTAFREISRILRAHPALPLQVSPTVSGAEAIDLVLEQLQAQQIPPRSDAVAIEMLGWLELPLDTAPALIVTSMNDGFVPTSLNSDLFLPETLRRKLGLVDNARRYARDAYALSVLLASRETVTLVVGRRDSEGNPLQPSRLLFACDAQTIARRAVSFFQPGSDSLSESGSGLPAPESSRAESDFVLYQPARSSPLTSISVTGFRSYLACPYRFYLRHVLNLRPVDDLRGELDAPTFGNVLHEVLNRFGRDPVRDSTNADEIKRFLKKTTDQIMETSYGLHRLPAVDVQILQLRLRLDAFAQWQADWASQGWQIRFTETSGGKEPIQLTLDDGRSVTLRGRIDRIDFDPEREVWAVFDYKTGEKARKPEQAHQRGSQWIDLQLPLYRHFLQPLNIDGPVRLGYIGLPKDVTRIGHHFADWSDQQFADADRVAREVATGVLDQKFWPPSYPAPKMFIDYAPICQDEVFHRQIQPLETTTTDPH